MLKALRSKKVITILTSSTAVWAFRNVLFERPTPLNLMIAFGSGIIILIVTRIDLH